MGASTNPTTFADNRALPVHRWFRYPAGYSGGWVGSYLASLLVGEHVVPFSPGQAVIEILEGVPAKVAAEFRRANAAFEARNAVAGLVAPPPPKSHTV